MKYTVIKANGYMDYVASSSGELLVFYPQRLDADKTAQLLNEETAPLREELATQAQALEAQSERIAALEKVIKEAHGILQRMPATPHAVTEMARYTWDGINEAYTWLNSVQKAQAPDAPVSVPIDINAVIDAIVEENTITTLCAIPVLQKRLVTKNNDIMALISMGDDTLVMFPRAWHEYKEVFVVAFENRKAITVKAKADYSHGELQYIFEEML